MATSRLREFRPELAVASICVLLGALSACGDADDVAGGKGGSGAEPGSGGGAGSGGSAASGGSGAAGGAGGSGGGSGGAGATGGAGGGTGGSGGGSGGTGGGGTGGGGTGGGTGSGGSSGTGGSPAMPPTWPDCTPWPQATGTVQLDGTEDVSGNFDGEFRRYVFNGDYEDAIFDLADNATLRNVIIGAPGADGIHCSGDCVLENVWWEDVGEDAATFQGESSSTRVTVDCAGARRADDKILQHNGGGTVTVTRFFAEDFGKVYRSCGNCREQFTRHVVLDNIIARAPGDAIAGVNVNYDDTATLTNVFLRDPSRTIHVCERYTGNDSGAEPPYLGQGPDPDHCRYSNADVVYFQ